MTASPEPAAAAGATLLAQYDVALPQVYGYLAARVPNTAVAEDLTSETFLAAIDAIQRGTLRAPTVAWLIGVARHKLVDHWRKQEREERRIRAVAGQPPAEDRWEIELDAHVAHDVLQRLGAHHRGALTLRYLDGLPVPEVAAVLGRTVHATEALLVRARIAFRGAYEGNAYEGGSDA
jgi:RNA polymerase sigma-70 factor (ECF subfamily)